MSDTADSVLAFDLGGTGMRAALVRRDGTVHCRQTIPAQEGWDADPARWWAMLGRAADGIAREAGPAFARVAALCLTGVTRTQVMLGRDGAPLCPAITVRDARAAELVASLPDLPHPEAAALNAYHPAARLLWLARHAPETLARTEAVVDPKDFLTAGLTDHVCTDPISGARLRAAADPASASLLGMLGLPSRVLPPVRDPATVVGPVRAGLEGALARLEGRPVAMAAHDTWACALGLGALRDRRAYNLSGTTEVVGVLSRSPAEAPGLVSGDWGSGLHHLGGPSNAGGATLAWAARLLGPGAPAGPGLDRFLRGQRQEQPALFLPYLDGERTPHWDPALRGAFLGLSHRHGPVDLAWAVLEGIACLNRIVLELAETACGRAVEFRFGGGGASSHAWCQAKADMLDRDVLTTAEPDAGLLGAGIAGWVALGALPGLAEAQAAMVRTDRVFAPAPERRDRCERLFAAYRAAEAAAAPISRALAGLA